MYYLKLLEKKYIFHILIWIFLVVSLVADSRAFYQDNKGTIALYIVSKTIIQAILVYTNILFFYLMFFKRRAYFLFFLFVILATLAAGYINMKLEIYVNSASRYIKPEQEWKLFLSQMGMASRYLLISFLLKISVDYYEQKETIKKIELEKTIAELNFLKAQVNPHFLLNTLNNLYGLIIERSEKSGETVLRLADILKYMLSAGKTSKVFLKREIELLANYTELERIRRPNAAIDFIVNERNNHMLITPMLLLPLVENAFKYGLNTVAKNGFVRINIQTRQNELELSVENNIPPIIDSIAIESMGIGIENVTRRLELLYPGKFLFTQEKKLDSYFVNLHLELA
ncbi:MAG TPA: histidine kinase [Puia sp.]|nr:histidine kinase [Puia sp.]